MDTLKIIETIKTAVTENKTVNIYYPKTENTNEGWRKIIPYNISTDIPPSGEILVADKDLISPGHIISAYDYEKKEIRSFIIGKIKKIKLAQ